MNYREDSKYYFLIAQDRFVERIDEFTSFDDYQKNSKYFTKKYQDFKIFVYETKPGQPCSYKVGDLIPSGNDHRCYMLKNKGLIVKSKRTPFIDNTLVLKSQFKNYLINLNQAQIDKSNSVLKFCQEDEELAYRAIYHSFKMYKTKDSTIDLAIEMLNLAGFEASENDHPYVILDKLKSANFDVKLISLFEDVINVFFYLDRNELDAWKSDMQVLFSAYHLFEKNLEFLLKISQDIIDKKGILFDEKNYILDWYEAGAMTLWEPLGLYRGKSKQEFLDLFNNLNNKTE